MSRPRQMHLLGAFTLGFSAIFCQILLLREFLVSFYGNELSAGILLGGWFFWTGLGGFLARLLPRSRESSTLFFLHGSFAFLVPITFIGLVLVRSWWGLMGQIVGFLPLLGTAWLIELPFCVISGCLFNYYCLLDYDYRKSVRSISRIYYLDSLGALSGGLLFSFVLIHFFGLWASLVLIISCNVVFCFLLGYRRSRSLQVVSIIAGAGVIGLILGGGVSSLESLYNQIRWGDQEIVRNEYTKYGNIIVTKSAEQLNFFENGLFLFSYPDLFSAENNVHIPLLQHASAEEILLIGGALGGEIGEVLKHHPRRITYVELDPQLIAIAQEYIPSLGAALTEKTEIRIHEGDGRYFISTTDDRYDVILLNLPAPCTAQINRFYTQEFFSSVRRLLQPGGIFSFKVTAAENYINEDLAQFLLIMEQTVKSTFSEVCLLPGNHIRFICSDSARITGDPDILLNRLEERKIKNLYVNQYYLPYELTEERSTRLKLALVEAKKTSTIQLNSDLAPLSYYFDMVLWSSQFLTWTKTFFKTVSHIKLVHVLGVCLILLVLGYLFRAMSKPPLAWFIGLPAGIIGFTEMTIEIILIVSFQILYGFTYYKMGLIVTFFMLGLALGSMWVTRTIDPAGLRSWQRLIRYQASMICYPLVLLGIIHVLTVSTHSVLYFVAIEIIFPLLAVVSGFIGGAHYPLSASLFLRTGRNISTTVSWLYWCDLLGSSLGALLVGAFLIPLLGINQTIVFVTCLNAIGLWTLLLSKNYVS